MTKNFCDKCKVRIGEDEMAKISLFGRINGEYKNSRYLFCENCFSEINTKFIGVILNNSTLKSTITS